MDPQFELHRSQSATDGPSAEELAMLVDGTASPWLATQLQDAVAQSDDLAATVRELLDPEHRAAVDRAGELLAGEEPKVIVHRGELQTFNPMPLPGPPPREVFLDLRPDYSWLMLGIAGFIAGFLFDHAKLALNLIGVALVIQFYMSYHSTRPWTHYQRAVAAGDTQLAEAILVRYRNVSGG